MVSKVEFDRLKATVEDLVYRMGQMDNIVEKQDHINWQLKSLITIQEQQIRLLIDDGGKDGK